MQDMKDLLDEIFNRTTYDEVIESGTLLESKSTEDLSLKVYLFEGVKYALVYNKEGVNISFDTFENVRNRLLSRRKVSNKWATQKI